MTWAEFIEGQGRQEFASKIGVTDEYVRVMISSNYISRQKWPDILLAYPGLGVTDLKNMETASKPNG